MRRQASACSTRTRMPMERPSAPSTPPTGRSLSLSVSVSVCLSVCLSLSLSRARASWQRCAAEFLTPSPRRLFLSVTASPPSLCGFLQWNFFYVFLGAFFWQYLTPPVAQCAEFRCVRARACVCGCVLYLSLTHTPQAFVDGAHRGAECRLPVDLGGGAAPAAVPSPVDKPVSVCLSLSPSLSVSLSPSLPPPPNSPLEQRSS